MIPTSPDFLKAGNKIRIVSTARKISNDELNPAVQLLEKWGLEVELGKHLFSEFHQFAGSDSERLADLQTALDDPEIKAIFCARGGYGTPRIIDQVNWQEFLKYPKWVVGFSDVTVLLNSIALKGIVSLHAPMPLFFTKPEYESSIERLQEFLFGKAVSYQVPPHSFDRHGNSSGQLVGGNLSLIVNSIGTPSAFDPRGKILFLEDIDEYIYHIDRMLLHLKRAKVLENLSGLLIGHFSDMKDNMVPFGETAYEIIAHSIADYSYPVGFGFPVGHEAPNMPLPVGTLAKLKVDNQGTLLDFS